MCCRIFSAFDTIQTGQSAGVCGGAKVNKPNTQWNLGITSDFEKSFLGVDQSPPACYAVSGFVAAGFCGVRRQTVKFNSASLGRAFDGKYQACPRTVSCIYLLCSHKGAALPFRAH